MRELMSVLCLLFISALPGLAQGIPTPPADHLVVRPTEIDDVLNNPGIGFHTFQRFNGDALNPGIRWTEGHPIEYQEFDGDPTNPDHPATTTAYFRVYWRYVETGPGQYNWPMPDKALRTANLGKKQKVLEETYSIDYTAIVDDYGRRIYPTIAPDNAKLVPGDSILKVLSFKTGKRICDNVECRLTFNRENIPGNYIAYYIQNNEEYDIIKGPIPAKITSSETIYSVSNYTKEELAIRERVNEIISAVYSEKDSSIIDSLYINFNDKYSDNIYVAQLKEFLELYSSVRKNKKN